MIPNRMANAIRRPDGVLLVILVVSLGMNVYLGIARTRAVNVQPSRPQLIAEGTQAPTFEGMAADGSRVTLDYAKDQRATLLYVFSPTCHWCERNLANLRAVVNTRHDLHIIGVNIGSEIDQKGAGKQPFAEILTPTSETVRAYRLTGTPSTLLISPSGRVLKAWTGAYAGPIATDVSKTLAVSLPGLLNN